MKDVGYINSVRAHVAERSGKVQRAVDLLYDTVRDYAGADGLDVDNEVALPEIPWGDDGSRAWLAPLGTDHLRISQSEVDASAFPVEHFIGSATLMLSDKGADAQDMFTVVMNPPNVLGYDGSPLGSAEIDGVLVDMQTYKDTLSDIYS